MDQIKNLNIKNLCGPLPLPVEVYSAGQPTERQFSQLGQCGIATVVNLRPDGEMNDFDEALIASRLGITYVQIQIASKADLTLEKATALANTLNNSPAPIFIHCAGGNRVGALLAVKAALVDGMTRDEALDLGDFAGLTELRDAVVAALG